jgi:hypothetical protein
MRDLDVQKLQSNKHMFNDGLADIGGSNDERRTLPLTSKPTRPRIAQSSFGHEPSPTHDGPITSTLFRIR